MRILLLLLVALSLLGQVPAELDAWAERVRTEFEVPGLAVAIVKDGQVVVARGYGVRQLGKPEKVDAQTLFGIASNTKAFTTAAIAILVEEGKLQWDDPVTKHLPGFAMYDPYVSRELTVRDLLTHRSGLGLGAGDLMFWPDTMFTRKQVVAGVRHLKPASSLRSAYAYNNTMYVVAGEVIAAVSGQPYEEFLRERILKPLGMNDTRISNDGLRPSDNTAVPHSRGWRLEGELKPISWTRDDVWAAAAGIKTNVTDLAKWVRVQLAQGLIEEDRRLFSERSSRQMHAANTVINIGQQPASLVAQQSQFSAYGLGWSLKDYRGHKVVGHTGGLTGMVSQTVLVPHLKLGVVILTNQEEGGAFQSLSNLILDSYLKAESPDWIVAIRQNTLAQRQRANEREKKAMAARKLDTRPSLEHSGYALTYQDPWYGQATVHREGEELEIRMHATPAMRGRLEHFQYNTFIVRWLDPTIPDAYCHFELNNQGGVSVMKLEAISDLADFSFDFHNLEFRPVPRK